jgi:hypothetical protein
MRVLKILGSLVGHLRFLHQGGRLLSSPAPAVATIAPSAQIPEVYSVILMEFDTEDVYGRRQAIQRQAVREIRIGLQGILEGKESILFYRERELLVFMPGVSSEMLTARVRAFREAFNQWQMVRMEERGKTRISLGFSTCEGEEDLSRILEIASVVMHPASDDE